MRVEEKRKIIERFILEATKEQLSEFLKGLEMLMKKEGVV